MRILGSWSVGWRGLLLACLCGLATATSAGEGQQFAEAYNALVRMAWSRADVVNLTHAPLVLKNPAQATVTRTDMAALRAYCATLLARFRAPPPYNAGPWNIDSAVTYQAFPPLFTAPIPFLLVPAEYTGNNTAVRTTTAGVNALLVPVLWEQLEDIRTQLLRARFTRHIGNWSANGTANSRDFVAMAASWPEVLSLAQSGWAADTPGIENRAPRFYTAAGVEATIPFPTFGLTAVAQGAVSIVFGRFLATAPLAANFPKKMAAHQSRRMFFRCFACVYVCFKIYTPP